MTDSDLRLALEAILTVAIEPVPSDALADLVGRDEEQVRKVLVDLRTELAETGRGFQLVELASGWRLQSNPEAAEVVQRFASRDLSARLSTAALETLAIVAYRQPVSRAQVATLRGVNVDGVVRLLEQRGYIEAVGRAEGPGQPILYGTSEVFLDRLGLASLSELPRPENLLPDANEVDALADEMSGAPTP
jgi:segregation and condensation protein B